MRMRLVAFLCVLVCTACAGDDSPRPRRISVNGRLQDGGLVGQVRANVNYELKDGSNPNLKTDYFSQQLDHFNSSNQATWLQYYWQNSGNYKPGGPIFILIGGEAPTSQDWIDDSNIQMTYLKLAKQYGAMAFQLEHRFYGRSRPTLDMRTDFLKYLTIEQALADLATFIRAMNQKYGWHNPKWITFGGSYSGALSAWFREKYPDLVVGAVASSAPVFAKVDFMEYFQVVNDSLSDYDPACVTAIQQATDYVTNLMATQNGQSMIKDQLKLCKDIGWNNVKDVQNFWSIIFGNFQETVQYSEDNRGVFADTVTIPKICDAMTSPSNPTGLAKFAAVNNILMKAFGVNCIDASYQSFINYMQLTSWSTEGTENRLWVWQTCTQLGYFQDTDQPGLLTFRNKIPISFYNDMCKDIFGPQFTPDYISKGVDATNAYFGGRSFNATKVVLPNGKVDPWHALGLLSSPNQFAPAIYIRGGAHCSDMYPARPQDRPDIVLAREIIDLNIGYWLRAQRD